MSDVMGRYLNPSASKQNTSPTTRNVSGAPRATGAWSPASRRPCVAPTVRSPQHCTVLYCTALYCVCCRCTVPSATSSSSRPPPRCSTRTRPPSWRWTGRAAPGAMARSVNFIQIKVLQTSNLSKCCFTAGVHGGADCGEGSSVSHWMLHLQEVQEATEGQSRT